MAFPLNRQTEAVSLPQPPRGTRTAPLHGATPPDGVRAGLCASAHPVRREARVPAGQHKEAAPSGAQSAGKSASLNLPAHQLPLPIVTRMGRDYRPGPRQRIERVARRAAPMVIGQTTAAPRSRITARFADRRAGFGRHRRKSASGEADISFRRLAAQKIIPPSRAIAVNPLAAAVILTHP